MMTKKEIEDELRRLGWKKRSGLYYAPPERGNGYLCVWKRTGMTLREAASIEGMSSKESLSEPGVSGRKK